MAASSTRQLLDTQALDTEENQQSSTATAEARQQNRYLILPALGIQQDENVGLSQCVCVGMCVCVSKASSILGVFVC